MRFTVLMPTWNRDYFLRNSIQSILDQTFKDFELLIVDDGSTDMSHPILKQYAKLDKRIRIIYCSEHQGLVSALNIGNEEALGKIIVKQDSDDLSLPNRLEVIDREMKDADFFYHGMYQTWESEDVSMTYRKAYIPALPITKRIFKEQYIPGAFAYTKKFITETPYRDLWCSEDWMLILETYLKKKKIRFANEGLYDLFLRLDSNSMVHEGTGHYEEDEKKMKEILKNEYNVKGFSYKKRFKKV